MLVPSVPRWQAGFTMVEVMIVLAVTSLMFISAVAFINGRQNRTQFTTAINLLQQQLQQIINETANGYYPQTTSFSCTRGSAAPPVLTNQSAADRQGQNPDCIFLGKVIQFAPDISGTTEEPYIIYPIIGNRLGSTNTSEASMLYDSPAGTATFPEAAARGTGTNTTLTSATTQASLTQGLTVTGMWYGTSSSQTTSTFGIISSLPNPSGAGVASGTQTMGLYTVASTALHQTPEYTADAIFAGKITSAPLQIVNSVSICLASGTTKQWGLITIGQRDASVASNLAVDLQIRDTAC